MNRIYIPFNDWSKRRLGITKFGTSRATKKNEHTLSDEEIDEWYNVRDCF